MKRLTGNSVAILCLLGCGTLAGQTYTFEKLPPPKVKNSLTLAYGINNRGAIVGTREYRTDIGGPVEGFKRDADGVFERPLSMTGNSFTGINDSGVICGNAAHGFLLNMGVLTDVDLAPGQGTTQIFGINNEGDFTGRLLRSALPTRGFLSINGQVTYVDIAGSPQAIEAHGIAEDGTVVGWAILADWSRLGFIRGPKGNIKMFEIPGADFTYALGVNNASHKIVGYYSVRTINGPYLYQDHGFVYDYLTGESTTVDYPSGFDPAYTQTYINGINSKGVIVGYARVPFDDVSFIGTPTQ